MLLASNSTFTLGSLFTSRISLGMARLSSSSVSEKGLLLILLSTSPFSARSCCSAATPARAAMASFNSATVQFRGTWTSKPAPLSMHTCTIMLLVVGAVASGSRSAPLGFSSEASGDCRNCFDIKGKDKRRRPSGREASSISSRNQDEPPPYVFPTTTPATHTSVWAFGCTKTCEPSSRLCFHASSEDDVMNVSCCSSTY
mmetsp:Transcript_67496/g.161984  ORF Transcript_67496/g.161984 Transcript_67496/m.161984 type:complete len:200 (+) Transcript_67496:546-1145(+)